MIVSSIIATSKQATENYAATCREFLEKVKEVRGMPKRIISGGSASGFDMLSSSGDRIREKFPGLLPLLMERLDWCIENYGAQAKLYREDQLARFRQMVSEFLEEVPIGSSKDKALKQKITKIKSEIRSLAKWDKLFWTYKASSFPTELEYIFQLESNPIACVWNYNRSDEVGEYRKTYDHRQRDGHVYAVRGNWAIEKGLMRAGPHGYVDEISRPCQEVGCMCRLVWVQRAPSIADGHGDGDGQIRACAGNGGDAERNSAIWRN